MPGTVNLQADRYTPYEENFIFAGIDLTDSVMKAQVRDRRDGGAIRATLNTVTMENTEGLRLVSAGEIDGIMTSAVAMFIDEATMEAMPSGLEIGDDIDLYWDLHITPDGGVKRNYLRGLFTVLAGATQ